MSNKSSNAKQTHTLQKQAKTLTSKHNKSSKTNNQINTDAGTASGRQGADRLGYSLRFLSYTAVTFNFGPSHSVYKASATQLANTKQDGTKQAWMARAQQAKFENPDGERSNIKVRHT